MLTRRDLLRALGASAAASALGACGGGIKHVARASEPTAIREDLRGRLREVVEVLAGRFPEASGLVHRRVLTEAAVDTAARGTRRELREALVLAARDDAGRTFEQVTSDVSLAGLARAASALLARAPSSAGRSGFTLGEPINRAPTLAADPAALPPARWLDEVARLHLRAEQAGSSRIIYRGAWIAVDDDDVLFVGRGRDVAQRLVQTRAGVALVAWNGTRPVAGEALVGGVLGLDALALSDDAIAAAAERALELMTPAAPPRGEFAVVLDPSVAAAVARVGVVGALGGDAWVRGGGAARARLGQPVASAAVTIVDDATGKEALGSYWFDDEGWPAQRTTLIEAGVLRGPLTDAISAAALGLPRTGNGRRTGGTGVMAPRPSNVMIVGGASSPADVMSAIDDGYLIEGAVSAHVEPSSWQLVVHAERCRKLAHGRRTGHVYGDVELRAEVPALLGAVTAVSTVAPGSIPGPAGDGEVASSARAPWLATRAMLAPRRGGA